MERVNGLLFYLSGQSTVSDYANGRNTPTFDTRVTVTDGFFDRSLHCDGTQLLAWRAPGNIYSQRGTLSFFWRASNPVGPTVFPIFRVSVADSSTWDQVWLRIDWNGEGFEAFITDLNLSRARVAYTLPAPLDPAAWTHLAVAWDENFGIKFYVNGIKVAEEYRPGVYSTPLDQFGPHAYIIGSWNVTSDYNYTRGGDLCELAIFDRMLPDEDVALLSAGKLPENLSAAWPDVTDETMMDGFRLKHGFNEPLPGLPARASIRKVEVHDAYDLKRWWWKGCDGIRETTWPGVYNRSRLKGRNDYFQIADWDCYSLSGKRIVFHMPDEPFNHMQISGSAHGVVEQVDENGQKISTLFYRPACERDGHYFHEINGGRVAYTNDLKEEPVGDFSFFHIKEGDAPVGIKSRKYKLRAWTATSGKVDNAAAAVSASVAADADAATAVAAAAVDAASATTSTDADAAASELRSFIVGRFPPYEQGLMAAVYEDDPDPDVYVSGLTTNRQEPINACVERAAEQAAPAAEADGAPFPFYNVIIPYTADDTFGLDGVEVCLPAFPVDTDVAIRIFDPLWYHRNLVHFAFSQKAGTAQIIWFDTRDRILPEGRCLYASFAFSSLAVTVRAMERATLRLVYKSAADAKPEHTLDRFTQVRDVHGHMVEETPKSRELNMLNRFLADLADLRKVAPEHLQGQYYERHHKIWNMDAKDTTGCRPPHPAAPVPDGAPVWAYRQIEQLRYYKHIVNWYIDERQIENGELGGGLSDDGDFIVTWVFLAQMGSDPDKVYRAMERNTDAFFDQGMMTNGLCSIRADELHSSEEGAIALAACLMYDPGNPKMLERAMETARSLDYITAINGAGHRHIRTSYFSGSERSLEAPWNQQRICGFAALNPAWMLSRFNANRYVSKILRELIESHLAHCKGTDDLPHPCICFDTDEESDMVISHHITNRGTLMAAYRQLGIEDGPRRLPEGKGRNDATGLGFAYMPLTANGAVDKDKIAALYEELNYRAGCLQYYSTLGSPWIDRVFYNPTIVSCHRLADEGCTTARANYPTGRVCWRFASTGDDERVAILAPVSEDDTLKFIVANISGEEVRATLIASEVTGGLWHCEYGADADGDDCFESETAAFTAPFERSIGVDIIFAPHITTIVQMRLLEKWDDCRQRYDLGVGRDDVRLYDHGLNVRVHSLGSVDTPEATVALVDKNGVVLRSATLPPLPAPADNWPRYRDVIFYLHSIPSLGGLRVQIDPKGELREITRGNNCVYLDDCEL